MLLNESLEGYDRSAKRIDYFEVALSTRYAIGDHAVAVSVLGVCRNKVDIELNAEIKKRNYLFTEGAGTVISNVDFVGVKIDPDVYQFGDGCVICSAVYAPLELHTFCGNSV